MANISHKTLGYAESHVIHFAEYADTAARTGAAGLTADDDNKIALQTDDNTFWMLTDHTGPTWVQVMGSFYSQSEVQAMVTMAAPVGTVSMTLLTTAPTGWFLLDGDTVGDASSGADHAHADYSALFAIVKDVAPNAGSEVWANHDTVTLPDMSSNFPIGATASLGATGGASTKDLSHTHTGPSHTHSIASHTHTITDEGLDHRSGGESSDMCFDAESASDDHLYGLSTEGSGILTSGADGTGATGSGGSATQDILPPYIKVGFIVKWEEY